MQVATGQFREDLMNQLKTYSNEAFKKGAVTFAVTQGESESDQTIEVSCHNYKLESFWTGEWQGTYYVKDGVLSGEIKIRAHYFEMGNMQFNLDK